MLSGAEAANPQHEGSQVFRHPGRNLFKITSLRMDLG